MRHYYACYNNKKRMKIKVLNAIYIKSIHNYLFLLECGPTDSIILRNITISIVRMLYVATKYYITFHKVISGVAKKRSTIQSFYFVIYVWTYLSSWKKDIEEVSIFLVQLWLQIWTTHTHTYRYIYMYFVMYCTVRYIGDNIAANIHDTYVYKI